MHLLRSILLVLSLTAPLLAVDAVPDPLMAYQGRLIEAGVVVNGNRTFTFAILDAGGTALWNSGDQSLTVTNGLYAVVLGGAGMPAIPTAVLNRTGLKLRVTVTGQVMSPWSQPCRHAVRGKRCGSQARSQAT